MGVTESRVPINTRDVLEKGITLYGSSRSIANDFERLMDYFKVQAYQDLLRKLVPSSFYSIRSIDDLSRAMERTIEQKNFKKILS